MDILLIILREYTTPIVALLGVGFTIYQLWGARKNRIADLEPKIGISLEFDEKDPEGLVFVAIENFGKTSAYDICITPEPYPLRFFFCGELNKEVVEDNKDIITFSKLSILHPGQKIRTLYSNLKYIQTGNADDMPILKFLVEYSAPLSLGKNWKPSTNEITIDSKYLKTLRLVKPKKEMK